MGRRVAAERGQSTVEWVALVTLVAGALALLGTLAGIAVPGLELAGAIGSRILCAVGLDASCERDESRLALAYGAETAALVARLAPTVLYEEGMMELPVDFRRCRADRCAAAGGSGAVSRTDSGLSATAFTRVVDCREGGAPPEPGVDCSGPRAGHLYAQYWLYFPDSQTEPWGEQGYHPDDWESFQVRLGEEAQARASSHHSYNYGGGIANWPTDAGIWTKPGWGPNTGQLHVSAGSHAGHVKGIPDEPRHTPAGALALVPLESLPAAGDGGPEFAVTPPWRKPVYTDPEAEGT